MSDPAVVHLSPRSLPFRALPVLLLGLLVLALLPAGGAAFHAHLTAATSRAAAADFAETAYGQPWDFSDPAQVPYGSTVQSITTGAGGLSFTAGKGQQLSLVRTELGAIPWGRDGSAHPIDASRFTRMAIRVKSDVWSAKPGAARGQIFWFSCQTMTKSCEGGSFFDVTSSGWQTIDIPLSNAYAGDGYPQQWSGPLRRLIITPNATSTTAAHMQIAWLRIYQPGAGSYQVQGVPAGAASVTWTRTATGDTGTLPVSGGTATFPADAYPAGSYDFSANGNIIDTLRLDQPSLVPWQSPDARGCVEYGRDVRKDAWDMSQPSDVARLLDAGNVSYAGGVLAATNAGPQQNDPEVWLHLGPPLDAKRFHLLRIRVRYDGPFGLGGDPGGGTVARVVWGTAAYNTSSTWQQSRPIVLYPGWNDVLIDMADPYNGTSDPSAQESVRYTWTQAGQITFLRFDPNEDPGARRWYVDSVQAYGDCTGGAVPRSTTNACPPGQVPSAGFADVDPASVAAPAIDCVVWWKVANGVTASSYLPARVVTRDVMAAFVARLIRASGGALPSNPPDAFPDDNGNAFEADINALAAAGIVQGSGGRYLPLAAVSRGAMAAFLDRAYQRVSGTALTHTRDYFVDDNGSTFENDINNVAAAGIAGGFADGTYRPGANVTRDQMALFLARELDLLVAKGFASPPAG